MHRIVALIQIYFVTWGRRWFFFIFRTLVVLAACVVSGISALPLFFRGGAQALQGGEVFLGFAGTQMVLILPIAAILGASTVSREREGKTLDILRASGVSPLQMVTGMTFSRWLPIVLGLMGSAPIAILLLNFGGITLRGALLTYALTLGYATFATGLASMISSLSASTIRSAVQAIVAVLVLAFGTGPLGLVLLDLSVGKFFLWVSPWAGVGEAVAPDPDARSILLRSGLWLALGMGAVLVGVIPAGSASPPRFLPPLRKRPRRRTARFRRYPLATVEVIRSRGVLFRSAAWLAVLVLLMAGGLAVMQDDPEVAVIIASTGITILALATWLASIVYSSSVFIEERRKERLSLILVSTRNIPEILRSKVLGVILRILPWLIVMTICALAIPAIMLFTGQDDDIIFFLIRFGWIMGIYIPYLGGVLYIGLWSGLVCLTPAKAVARTLWISVLYFFVLYGIGCMCCGLPAIPASVILTWALDSYLKTNFNRLVGRF